MRRWRHLKLRRGVFFNLPWGLISVTASAGLASATGVAQTPTSSLPGTIPAATATAAAYDIFIVGNNIPAAALATGAAYQPLTSDDPVAAGQATATGAAYQPLQSDGTATGMASATGTAYNAAVPLQPPPVATATGAAFNAVAEINSPALEVYGFGSFSQVPAGSPILSVIADILQYGSNTTIPPTYQLWDGTSAQIGSTVTGTTSATPGNRDYAVFTGMHYSQLATLRLRIYANSGAGNSGATVNVDAVSLSVNWLPNTGITATPLTLAIVPVINGGTPGAMGFGQPALATAAAYLPAVQAFGSPNIHPATLRITPVFPPVSNSVNIAPATLAVTATVQQVIDVTLPGWGTAEGNPVVGSGSWVNGPRVTGSPDGSYATWTVP